MSISFLERVPGLYNLANIAFSQPRPELCTPVRVTESEFRERIARWKEDSVAASDERQMTVGKRKKGGNYDVAFDLAVVEAEATILYLDIRHYGAARMYWSDKAPATGEVVLGNTLCTLSPTPCGRTGTLKALGVPVGSYQILTAIDKDKGKVPGPAFFSSLIG